MKSMVVLMSLIFIFVCVPVRADGAVKPTNNLGIVGWWPMNEGTSTIAHDISGYGNNGTLTGTPITWASGKKGASILFDGSTSVPYGGYVQIPNSSVLQQSAGGDFTVSLWLYPSRNYIAGGANDNIIEKATDSASPGWGFYVDAGNNLKARLGYSGNSKDVVLGNYGSYFATSTWTHLVFRVDRASNLAQWFVNGVAVGSATDISIVSSMINTSNLNIGAGNQGYGISRFAGKIDDVRIYSRALPSSEIASLSHIGQVTRQTVSQSGLVGWWTFDEGTSTKATDFSGQGNTGTLSGTGGPTWIGGKRGKALNFAGQDTNNNQTVTITAGATNPELAILGDVTVSAWIRPSSSYFDTAEAVVRAGSGADLDYSLFYDPVNQRPYFHWYDGGFPNVTGTTNSVPFNQWSLVTIVRSGLTTNFYVNGVFTNSAVVTAPTVAAAQIAIGRTNNVGVPQDFSGDIDDVRIYNRALSASEVSDLYRQNQTEVGGSKETSVSDGLVGYWSFNGKDMNWTGNLAYDRSGNGNNSSLVSMSMTTSPVAGRVGQALYFNGSNSYVTASDNSSLNLTSQISYGGWIRFSSLPVADGNYMGFVFKMSTGAGNIRNGYSLQPARASGQTKFSAFFGIDNFYNTLACTPVIETGVWYHVMITRSGTSASCYINGVLDNSATFSESSWNVSNTSLDIGRNWGGSYLNGNLDEIRVYNRALSASEVKRLYNLGK